MKTYEGMFLIDNEAVRAGWSDVKARLAALIEKHGGQVLTSRRWDERRLTYPVRRHNRATFLLAYWEMEPGAAAPLRQELELDEQFLRYLVLSAAAVPKEEHELARAEEAPDFQVPEPPSDDAEEEPQAAEPESREASGSEREGEASPEGAEKEGAEKEGAEKGRSGAGAQESPEDEQTGEPRRPQPVRAASAPSVPTEGEED